jgi:chromate reductase, NAD(P)H dehydrogenase (quinone)
MLNRNDGRFIQTEGGLRRHDRENHTGKEDYVNNPLTILGIAGSLRKGSYNRAALKAAQQLAPQGVKVEIFDLNGVPGFNQDEEQNPPAQVAELKARIRAADAILLVTPEHNYSVPGVLKNAIDWASRPYGDSAWDDKPVAILGASVGFTGTARAQYHLRQSFVFLNMHPLNRPEVMIGNAQEKFDANGNLTDEKTRQAIKNLLESLVTWTHHLERGRQTAGAGKP